MAATTKRTKSSTSAKVADIGKFRRPANQVAAFSEIGYTGLNLAHGTLREEFLPELQGREGIKIFKEMRDNDPIVGSVLFTVGMLIREATRTVKAFKEKDAKDEKPKTPAKKSHRVTPFARTAADEEAAKFVDSCFDDMSHTQEDLVSEALSMLPFGWATLELVYKKREGDKPGEPGKSSKFTDGKIGWRKMPLRSQDTLDRWEMDDAGGIHGMWQKPKGATKSKFIPIHKLLLFRTESHKNNPQGRSVLRNAYRPWYFKKRIEEIEGIGIERDLAGLPVLETPEGIDIWDPNNPLANAQKYEAEKLIQNIKRDEQEGVLLPFGWVLSLLSTGGARNFDTSQIVDRYNTQIALTCIADFIVLGHNNRYGSFALAGSKTHMFGVAIGGWLGAVAAVFNRYAIPRLLELNGMDASRPPTFAFADVEVPDLESLGSYINNLHSAGFKMFPNEPLEKKLLEMGGLPTEGLKLGQEEPLPQPAAQAPGAGGRSGAKPAARPAARPAPRRAATPKR